MVILIIYVDDVILTCNDEEEISRLKRSVASKFEIKDIGPLHYSRSRKCIYLSQRKYVLDLLQETRMSGCRPSDTPMDPNRKLGAEQKGTRVEKRRYQCLVGKLIYLTYKI